LVCDYVSLCSAWSVIISLHLKFATAALRELVIAMP
jgi:hypothetical protein